ncbi:hypothetical protein NL676_010910 [Syzygium grande]|nr:hypothetical protein NL676_010910 [Syzygium grande]
MNRSSTPRTALSRARSARPRRWPVMNLTMPFVAVNYEKSARCRGHLVRVAVVGAIDRRPGAKPKR